MKRKLFTLLFALVALASFQVSANGPWWIKADTTGIGGLNSYNQNKVSLPNWLVYTTPDSAGINKNGSNIRNDGPITKFDVTPVAGLNNRILNIKSMKPGAPAPNKIELTYESASHSEFEVVRFTKNANGGGGYNTTPGVYGFYRTVQQFDATTGVEGYLMPRQGGLNMRDTTFSLQMVVADKNQQLHIKNFNQVFSQVTLPLRTYATGTTGMATVITGWDDYFTTLNETNRAAINAAITSSCGASTQEELLIVDGAYSRNIAYLSTNSLNTTINSSFEITDPRQVTEFIDGAWSNGAPKDFGSALSSSINDGNGTNGSHSYVIVVENLPVGGSLTAVKNFYTGEIEYSAKAKTEQWRPVYIKLEKPTGRWATTADFAGDCLYKDFKNLSVAKDPKALAENPRTAEMTSIFRVTQVDWISNQTPAEESGQNIFGTTDYKSKSKDAIAGKKDTGMQQIKNPTTNNIVPVIPLFILSSPQNCDVVSVSRQNELVRQDKNDGVYGNRLELRPYGTYYDYERNSDNRKWEYKSKDATAANKRQFTSLQKFAIWINEDGEKTIYPAASYFWKYGELKNPKIGENYDFTVQPNTVYPNSVLMYNNTEISGSGDMSWGVQINTWTTNQENMSGTIITPEKDDIVTGPNNIQTFTSYQALKLNIGCPEMKNDPFEGRFFFLQVDKEAIGVGNLRKILPLGALATQAEAYQDSIKTEYVLSTEIVGNLKKLVVVPKERVRRYNDEDQLKTYDDLKVYKRIEGGSLLRDYWTSNPYDSVNMAAHWGIYKSGSKYVLVNMLGDTLQYDLGTSLSNITGGYLPVNSDISKNGLFSPSGNYDTKWFAKNSLKTANYLWNVDVIPGKDGFVLNLSGYTLKVDGDWYGKKIARKNPTTQSDSLYYQRNVVLFKNSAVDNNTTLYKYEGTGFECAGGLAVKKEPIYYVPNYSGSYKGETDKSVINTNDPNFADGNAKVYQDSLSAYLLLDGYYGIEEATKVGNSLYLTSEQNHEDGRNAAVLGLTGATNIEFIPLATVARERNANIVTAKGSVESVDALFGETYKWFLVKLGEQYLVFDTLNLNAATNDLKLGFVFKDVDIANATPVRLYQPLVGDKLQGNFLIEFYTPQYNYNVDSKKKEIYKWNQINTNIKVGQRYFAKLVGDQSNYISATLDKKDATRFTYELQGGPDNCGGCKEFIDPKWMASEKLVNFNVYNQRWIPSGADKGFTGFSMKASSESDNRNKVLDEAIIAQSNGDFSKIKHVYVDSIKNGVWTYSMKGIDNIEDDDVPDITNSKTGFQTDLDVALYYIVNEDGYYLTVDTTTYFSDDKTADDVTGVNLVWRPELYEFNVTPNKNKRALQLFAITGIPSNKLYDGDWYTDCGSFAYLPLASYKVNYTKGVVLHDLEKKDVIYYNTGLGKSAGYDKCSDPTGAFRVALHIFELRDQKNLIVANATGAPGNANYPAVEFKWKKEKYDEIDCDYALVKDITKADKQFYYASGGAKYDSLCYADSNTILAHWTVKHDDNQVHSFTPEKIIGYGKDIPANTQLKGEFYFKWNADRTELTAISFANYNWTTKYRTDEYKLDITCVKADLPFANLEKAPLGYSLPQQLAILEAPFVDRNLTDSNPDHPSVLLGNNHYQTYINKIEDDIKEATYVTTYLIQERELTKKDPNLHHVDGEHVIPYYAFSIKRVNPADNKEYEYFLNVNTKQMNGVADSVHWTTLTEDQYIDLMAGKNNMQLYQFCLPYRVDENRNRKEVSYPANSGNKFNPVYLQTLDTARTNYPYLVISGGSTGYVTAKNLSDAMTLNTGCSYTEKNNSLDWNIYTVDYSQIDQLQVTAWIFAGQQPGDHEWVPLRNAYGVNPYEDPAAPTETMSTEGLLANFKGDATGELGFVAESKQAPVNHGMLLGSTKLFFEYEGQEKIGTMWQLPIYYYRIQIEGADATKKWLTDAHGETGNGYSYLWDSRNYQIAYFGDKITDNVSDARPYDKKYVQTFGLRYTKVVNGKIEVGDDKVPGQTFTVVSNANFDAPVPNKYRYLADVNGHLVFVENIENAMLFQYGKNNGSGYTEIEVVGQGEVFGVSGGVRLLNQTGAVGLYTIDGRLIKSVEITAADQTITAPRGVVIVKADGKATKVVVK